MTTTKPTQKQIDAHNETYRKLMADQNPNIPRDVIYSLPADFQVEGQPFIAQTGGGCMTLACGTRMLTEYGDNVFLVVDYTDEDEDGDNARPDEQPRAYEGSDFAQAWAALISKTIRASQVNELLDLAIEQCRKSEDGIADCEPDVHTMCLDLGWDPHTDTEFGEWALGSSRATSVGKATNEEIFVEIRRRLLEIIGYMSTGQYYTSRMVDGPRAMEAASDFAKLAAEQAGIEFPVSGSANHASIDLDAWPADEEFGSWFQEWAVRWTIQIED